MTRHPDLAPLWRDESLDPAQRATLLEHFGDCLECRGTLAQERPELLFSLLATDPVPVHALERLSARVAGEIARTAHPAVDRAVGARRWVPIAASLMLASLVGAYVWHRGLEPPATVRAGRAPIAPSLALGAIEVDEPGAARVVNVKIGDTTVVMIFDAGLDL